MDLIVKNKCWFIKIHMSNLEGVEYTYLFRLNIFKLLREWGCKTLCFHLEKMEFSPSHSHSLGCYKQSRCFSLRREHLILGSAIMWFQ